MRKWKIILGSVLLSISLTACGEKGDSQNSTGKTSENEVSDKDGDNKEVQTSDEESGNQQESGEETKQNNQQETTAIKIKMVEEPKEYNAEDGTSLVSGSFRYPVVTIENNEEAAQKINDDIAKEKAAYEKSFNDYVELAKTDYESAASNPDYEFTGYNLTESFQVQRNNNNVLALTELDQDYTGGAHGNYGTYGINYDITTGERITLENLSEDASKFRTDILEKIKEMAKTDSYKQMLDEGYENNLESVLLADGKWYFSNSGLLFFANPYELGCYAAGTIEFSIPYEELSGLKENYAYTGNFEKRVPVGTEAVKDINGDGKEETIYYQVTTSEETGGYNFEFTIDGKDFASLLSMEGPDNLSYYLVDIDNTDDFIEIAVQDYGPSSDYNTFFYRYQTDGSLKDLGAVSDLWSGDSNYLESNGLISGNQRLALLQTWYAPCTWKLGTDGVLVQQEQDMYYPTTGNTVSNSILRNVSVYSAMDLKSEAVELTPEDGAVTFTATDNKNWVEFVTKDGRTFYLYMKEFSTIISGQEELEAATVFDKLIIAD